MDRTIQISLTVDVLVYSHYAPPQTSSAVKRRQSAEVFAMKCRTVLNRHVEPIWMQEGSILHQLSIKLPSAATVPMSTSTENATRTWQAVSMVSSQHCQVPQIGTT